MTISYFCSVFQVYSTLRLHLLVIITRSCRPEFVTIGLCAETLTDVLLMLCHSSSLLPCDWLLVHIFRPLISSFDTRPDKVYLSKVRWTLFIQERKKKHLHLKPLSSSAVLLIVPKIHTSCHCMSNKKKKKKKPSPSFLVVNLPPRLEKTRTPSLPRSRLH